MKEEKEEIFEIYPINLSIPHGQSICLYEEDQTLRNNILYGLTRNLCSLSNPSQVERNIFVGGVPISTISSARSNHLK